MRWIQALSVGLAALLAGCAPAGDGGRPASGAAPAAPTVAPPAPEAAPRELQRLVFAVPQVNGTTMAYAIGAEQGFFRDEGFEVDLPAMRTELIAAGMLSGEVDYISAFSPAVNNALTGVPLRLVEKGHLGITEDVPFARVADFGPLYEVLAEMGITPGEGSAR